MLEEPDERYTICFTITNQMVSSGSRFEKRTVYNSGESR